MDLSTSRALPRRSGLTESSSGSTSRGALALRRIVAAPQRGDLTRIEDEIDAILCAHLAWLWHRHPESLQVYGSLAEGYIVAPPPPTLLPDRD
jgi:predicted RNase H-like nuclease